MSDPLKHECGIAMVRLLKPLDYYLKKYGTPLYGFHQLFMLMEKQHNRGQDGAGMGCVKLNIPAGKPFMFRDRNANNGALGNLLNRNLNTFQSLVAKGKIDPEDMATVKQYWDFGGEVLMGHMRYATSGSCNQSSCHPYFRRSNWPTRNLMLAGNFNMTNVDRLHGELVSRGQHPVFDTDTKAILELIGYQLDEEHSRIYRQMRSESLPGKDIPGIISQRLDPSEIIRKAAENWDGGYTIGGLIGNGDAFVLRDPLGIRPGFFYQDEEIVAVASERVALMTAFDLSSQQVQEIEPGYVLVIKNDGSVYHKPYADPRPMKRCSFERIYFSRGNDPDIYQERKALGGALAESLLESVDYDLKKTIFSYVPNTAEAAYYGLMDRLRALRRRVVREKILKASKSGELTGDLIDKLIMDGWPRREKIAIKDIKLRTFISQEDNRLKLASHVYDITYGVVGPEDNLVCLDDSIVRGTTLKQSILKILGRTKPKKIIVASTAPQIRYPDCYGIDMSELGKFIAFQGAISLIQERGMSSLIDEVYAACLKQKDSNNPENLVKKIYDPFSDKEISAKVAELVRPQGESWNGEIVVVFQSVEKLRACLGEGFGDWYFTGDYPTPGGYRVLNQAFINYYENRKGRSY